jgi:hypothetical protein
MLTSLQQVSIEVFLRQCQCNLISHQALVCKAIFGWPSWLHVVGYSLLLPCSFLVCCWLINKAAEKGQLAQRLKETP